MFDPSGNAVLSIVAASLDAAALTAQARVAERLLRVDPAVYDGLDATKQEIWGQMVCLQINFQVERPESYDYRAFGDVQERYAAGPVSEAARLLRDAFFADGSEAAVSDGAFSMDAIYDPEDV